MKTMTRRTFLKTTGTLVAAAGIAGALSGCGPVDDAISNALGDNAIMMSGVGFAWVNNRGQTLAHPDDPDGRKGQSYFLYAVKLSVANLAGGSVTLNHSDFSLTVNGQETEGLYGDAFTPYAEIFGQWFQKEDLLLDAGGTRNIPLNPTGLNVPKGWLAFRIKPVEGKAIPGKFRSLKIDLTIRRNNEAKTITITYDENGKQSVSS